MNQPEIKIITSTYSHNGTSNPQIFGLGEDNNVYQWIWEGGYWELYIPKR